MNSNLQTNLLIAKISLLKDFSIDFLEKNFRKLTPASKYQTQLITTSIIINSLKRIGAFRSTKFETEYFHKLIFELSLETFEKYKKEHDITYNTYSHTSAIISNRLNTQNRVFFRKSPIDLKRDLMVQLLYYNDDLEYTTNFYNIYVNLFCFPNFNAELADSEQENEKYKYIEIIQRSETNELDSFKFKLEELINIIRTKLNEDSYFISIFSKPNGNFESQNKNCYIATTVYENINHPKVAILRYYRDFVLANNNFGRYFIKVYYKLSPHLVKRLRKQKYIKNIIRVLLNKFTNIILKKLNEKR